MEALAVAFGGCPGAASATSSSFPSSLSSSSPSSTTSIYVRGLYHEAATHRLPHLRHLSLAAFQSPSHLFSSTPSFQHSHRRLRGPHIFLPRLVAAMEEVEKTYIMVKPDGVQRGLVGEIISRFERKGFKLTGLKLFKCPKELAEEHYKDLASRPFFPKLIGYITSGPVVCMAWEGVGVVASARKLIGATNPLQAEPGTIRGDLAVQTGRNVVHGSDSPENGEREIALWFKEGELCDWTPVHEPWVTE